MTFFQKNHLAQTMGCIVLYPLAKNWEDPWSSFEEKAKNHHTDGQNDGMTDKQGSIYRTILQSQWVRKSFIIV